MFFFSALFLFYCFKHMHTHTHTDVRGVSYRDTIVCAVSKGDLFGGLWCAVISPTSVNSTHAGAYNQGGWEAGLTTCSSFLGLFTRQTVTAKGEVSQLHTS